MRHREWLPNELCSVAGALEVMGERWTILVLREAFLGTRRFDDFHRNIGCARNILSNRLHGLVANGIMSKTRYSDHPPRYEYRLTDKGVDLYPTIVTLMQWGDKHVEGRVGPPVVLEHKTCGHRSAPLLVCSHCGGPVHARAMRAHPGPGALESA